MPEHDFASKAREAKSAPEKTRLNPDQLTDQRFNGTKTGLIGFQRDSMLDNELHLLV